MSSYLFTSESVTEGHPDKVCDQISDAILDETLRQDQNSRVACEVCAYENTIDVFGEMTTHADIDIEKVVRKTLNNIGYNSDESGFNGNTCHISSHIHEQSPDIALGTNDLIGGAGDQGMMFGYACRDSKDYMPLPISLANSLSYKLAQARKLNTIENILPDGKTQVTVEYTDGIPTGIDTIVLSTQHKDVDDNDIKQMKEALSEIVIEPVLTRLHDYNPHINITNYKCLINPTGRFTLGGPNADSGLTGRKIIVDTYGGYAPHGGGAFSGKDPTKVDRSAAYMARNIAKNIVASGKAYKCLIELAYAIGVPEPVSIYINTYGTSHISDEELIKKIRNNYDLTPQGIINLLNLRSPIYLQTAAYGHFGAIKEGYSPSWERVYN